MPADPTSRLAFLHVPKAAGTALTAAIDRALGAGSLSPIRFDLSVFGTFDRFGELSPGVRGAIATTREEENALGEARFAAGHFYLSTLERHFELDQIFTVLREPRARLLSHYDYWRHQQPTEREHWAPYDHPKSARQPLSAFLRDRRVASSTDNVLCRMLLGPSPVLPIDDFIAEDRLDSLATAAFERLSALRAVALFELDGPSFTKLAESLQVRFDVERTNVTTRNDPEGDRRGPIDAETAELLRVRSAADVEVYRKVVERRYPDRAEASAAIDRAFRERWFAGA